MKTFVEFYSAQRSEIMPKNFDDFVRIIRETHKERNEIPRSFFSESNVKRGLRNADGTGVLAGLTTIGEVHGYILDEGVKTPVEGSLRYRGIDLYDIVRNCQAEDRLGFEETTFLILFGFLPNRKQLAVFVSFLEGMRALPDNFTEDMILKAPSKNIMNKIARSVLALYSYDDNPDDLALPNLLKQCMGLIAKFPSIIAYAYAAKQHYYDNKSLVLHHPNPDLSTAENFFYMIRSDHEYSHLEAQILDLALIIHAEHGGGNNSAFATRVLSSSGTDTYSAIAAAIGSLKGPKHGGANEKMMAQMNEIKANVKDWSDEDEVYGYLVNILNKEAGDGTGLIYGVGHAVYTLSDPRAVLLKEKMSELAELKGFSDEFKLYNTVARLAPKAFSQVRGFDRPLCANVDFYSGFVYKMLDIPSELYTPIFAMARIVGWSAHRIEEVLTGQKIIRPAYKSIAKRKEYVPIDLR